MKNIYNEEDNIKLAYLFDTDYFLNQSKEIPWKLTKNLEEQKIAKKNLRDKNIYYFSKIFMGVNGLQQIKKIAEMKKIKRYSFFSLGTQGPNGSGTEYSIKEMNKKINDLYKKYNVHFIAKNGNIVRVCISPFKLSNIHIVNQSNIDLSKLGKNTFLSSSLLDKSNLNMLINEALKNKLDFSIVQSKEELTLEQYDNEDIVFIIS